MLQRLDFGEVEAEKDHQYLDKAFVDSASYRLAQKDQNLLILGRKGAGKSAFAYDYSKMCNADEASVCMLTPTHFSFSALEPFKGIVQAFPGFDCAGFFERAWRYTILTSAMARCFQPLANKPLTGDAGRVYQFLKQSGLLEKGAVVRFIDIATSLLRAIPTAGISDAAKALQAISNYSVDEIEQASLAFRNWLNDGNGRCLVLIDDVDRDWNSYTSVNEAFIRGLIAALLGLTPTDFSRNLVAKALMPTDIMRAIVFRHRDKMSAYMTSIIWESTGLKELIGRRIAVSLGIKRDGVFTRDYDYCWKRVFPSEVTNKIWKKENVQQYIFRHTQYRPRDVLTICKQIVNSAQQRKHDEIQEEDVIQGVEEGAREVAESVVSEYSAEFPRLNDLLLCFAQRSNVLEYSAVKEIVESNLPRLGMNDVGGNTMLDKLYAMGFLGALFHEPSPVLTASGPLKREYFWYIQESIPLHAARRLLIHPTFYEKYHINPEYDYLVGLFVR